MSVDRAIADRIVEVLNEALELDPQAVEALVNFRTPCGERLAAHPSIQVGKYPDHDGPLRVGLLGLLNGIAGAGPDGWGAVAAIVDSDSGEVQSFGILEERATA